MELMKTKGHLFLPFLVCFLSSNLNASKCDSLELRHGLIVGFNQFIGLYFPWETHYANEVSYGYNVGYFKEGKRMNLRVGVNTNCYRVKSNVRIVNFEIGIEVGPELRIVPRKSNWVLNISLLAYKGWAWSTHHNTPTSTIRYLIDEWGIGPDVMFGRKLNNTWTVTFENSFAIGHADFLRNGDKYYEKWPASRTWKYLGFGLRFNVP